MPVCLAIHHLHGILLFSPFFAEKVTTPSLQSTNLQIIPISSYIAFSFIGDASIAKIRCHCCIIVLLVIRFDASHLALLIHARFLSLLTALTMHAPTSII
jgi:hypothetical protein